MNRIYSVRNVTRDAKILIENKPFGNEEYTAMVDEAKRRTQAGDSSLIHES